MNDRFKFRTWDKEINKFRYGDVFLTCEGQPFVITCDPENPVEYLDNVEINFCTGLKDCNKKYIYENDIVRFDDESNFTAQFRKEYDRDYGRVEFILIGGHPKYPTIYIPAVAHESEIIGNIYTTPELLEGKNV